MAWKSPCGAHKQPTRAARRAGPRPRPARPQRSQSSSTTEERLSRRPRPLPRVGRIDLIDRHPGRRLPRGPRRGAEGLHAHSTLAAISIAHEAARFTQPRPHASGSSDHARHPTRAGRRLNIRPRPSDILTVRRSKTAKTASAGASASRPAEPFTPRSRSAGGWELRLRADSGSRSNVCFRRDNGRHGDGKIVPKADA